MIDNYDWSRLESLGFDGKTIEELNAFDFSSGLTRRRRAKAEEDDYAEKLKGLDGAACWKGYKLAGTKKKGNRTVDNCVKIDSKHSEGDIATSEMTPNYLPQKEIPGGGDPRTPRMAEAAQRMPRDTVLKKLNDKDGLAMEAAPNYSEDGHDAFHSEEPNAAMIVNNLRVIREKTDILLGMLDGTENLPPWCFVKITNAGTGLASVADYLRYGTET
jgi:hypothetical protein